MRTLVHPAIALGIFLTRACYGQEELFYNLVPYTHPSASWSDRYSNVAISWPEADVIGLQRLQAVVGWAGTKITDRLLSWTVTENGAALPLRLRSRTYRPDRVVEHDESANLELQASAAYIDRNTIAVEFEIRNLQDRERFVTLGFHYPGEQTAPDWDGPFKAGQFVRLENQPAGSWATLYVHHEHGRSVPWVQSFVAGATEGTTLQMVSIANLQERHLRVDARGSARTTIVMAFGRYNGEAVAAFQEADARIRKGWTPAEETTRWREIVAKAQPLPAENRDQPAYRKMYLHAIASLDSLYIRGEGGYTGARRIPYTTKDDLAIAFFWDTAFSSTGAREFNPTLSREALESFAINAGPRGALPGTLSDSHRAGEGQAPIMAWSTWLVYNREPQKEWLALMYPALKGNVEFWFKYHASARGLAKFFNAGQIGDNDARFDPVYNRQQGNEPVAGFESPDLNALLVNEMRCLSRMARILGNAAEASQWNERADSLAKKIVDTMYFPEDAMFFDVKEGTHEKFSGVKNPNMFLPLWAGVPLPAADTKKIIERHMLNPAEFFRELPFPSLSYDNPKYDPKSYWRGRIWPHIAYWMTQTLWRNGYHDEADLTARRLLRMFQKMPWFMENFESTEEGLSAAPNTYNRPEYNWSDAAVIELLLQRYREPLPE